MRFFLALWRWFTSLLLHLSVLGLIASLIFVLIFSNRQTVKDALIESDVYNKFVVTVINDNNEKSSDSTSSLPFDDPEIIEIAKKSFSPSSLKNASEGIIDQIYTWLEGDVASLQFEADFSKQSNIFIDLTSSYAANRLTELPACGTTDISNITVFELQCRPENVPYSFVKDRVTEDLQASDFFNDMTISQDDLPKTQDGRSLDSQFSFIPEVYSIAKNGIWIFSSIFLIAAVVFVLARRPYRKGFKVLGRDLLSNGATLVAMTFIFGFILPRYTNSFNIKGSETTQLMNGVTNVFVRRFDVLIINICLQIIALAIVILAIERLSRPSSKYSNLSKKSGVSTSHSKQSKDSAVKLKNPPLQTSETKQKTKTSARPAKKYRKIQL